MLTQEQINGKWLEIRSGVRNLWGNLSEDEIDKYKQNLYSLSPLILEKYRETNQEIKKKIDKLLDSFDNETDKSLKFNDGESSYKRNPTHLREEGRKNLDDYPTQ